MKSKQYTTEVKVRPLNRIAHAILRLLFPNDLRHLSALNLTIVSRGVTLMNLLVQRVIGINSNVPFMVNYTSRVLLADAIEIEDSPDSASVYSSFAASGGCYITGHNGIVFHRGVRFAPGVKIISSNHDFQNLENNLETNPIIIGQDCWIGANAIILPGISLGARSVIGAGSVVSKDVPAGEIWGGVPARKLGQISDLSNAA